MAQTEWDALKELKQVQARMNRLFEDGGDLLACGLADRLDRLAAGGDLHRSHQPAHAGRQRFPIQLRSFKPSAFLILLAAFGARKLIRDGSGAMPTGASMSSRFTVSRSKVRGACR